MREKNVKELERASNPNPAIKMRASTNPHIHKILPLGFFWNNINPHIANIIISKISTPEKYTVTLKLNMKEFSIKNVIDKTITIVKMTGKT